MGKIKVGKKKVLDAITKAHGMKTGVCELLGISRPTLDRYIKKDADLLEAFEFSRVRWKDRAEYKLHEAIERGEQWAVMFTLKNAHDREYNDRVQVTFETMNDEKKREYIRDLITAGGFLLAEPEGTGLDDKADSAGETMAQSSPPRTDSASG